MDPISKHCCDRRGTCLLTRTFSFFSRLNDENRWNNDTPDRGVAGAKSARKMFGSIERSLDKFRLMLTPRRRQLQRLADSAPAQNGGPNVVPNKVRRSLIFRWPSNCCSFFSTRQGQRSRVGFSRGSVDRSKNNSASTH